MSKKDYTKSIETMLSELIALNKNYTRKIESKQKLQTQKNKIIQDYLDKV